MHDTLREAWALLAIVARHFLACNAVEACEQRKEQSLKAAVAIRKYAQIAEEKFPALCTSNLHMLVCRLHDQELIWGDVAGFHEFWVEQGVQEVKQDPHSEFPEMCYANRLTAQSDLHRTQGESSEGIRVNVAQRGTIQDAFQHLRLAFGLPAHSYAELCQ